MTIGAFPFAGQAMATSLLAAFSGVQRRAGLVADAPVLRQARARRLLPVLHATIQPMSFSRSGSVRTSGVVESFAASEPCVRRGRVPFVAGEVFVELGFVAIQSCDAIASRADEVCSPFGP